MPYTIAKRSDPAPPVRISLRRAADAACQYRGSLRYSPLSRDKCAQPIEINCQRFSATLPQPVPDWGARRTPQR